MIRVFRLALLLLLASSPARAVDVVTEWTLEADRLGRGGANWRSLAIMHMAMHDAAQAIEPRYARWSRDPALPVPRDASLEAAIAAAAARVLVDLHPNDAAEIDRVYRAAIARLPPFGLREGQAIGDAIGHATAQRRANDGFRQVHAFRGEGAPGRWRPTPPDFATSNTTAAMPFLFPSRDWPGARPPPAPGSDVFLRDAAEARRLGQAASPYRAYGQTDAAEFWAYQSSQRGYVLLAVRLLDADAITDLAGRARLMSLLTAAMADSAILVWAEKERFMAWRPITVIRSGADGAPPISDWQPTIETPPHPEYPSGHATDCFTGSLALSQLFGISGPIDYVALSALPQAETAAIGMGQHAQFFGLHEETRHFLYVSASAYECADSRIWAGAHFRYANEEARRLASAIIQRAATALPALSMR